MRQLDFFDQLGVKTLQVKQEFRAEGQLGLQEVIDIISEKGALKDFSRQTILADDRFELSRDSETKSAFDAYRFYSTRLYDLFIQIDPDNVDFTTLLLVLISSASQSRKAESTYTFILDDYGKIMTVDVVNKADNPEAGRELNYLDRDRFGNVQTDLSDDIPDHISKLFELCHPITEVETNRIIELLVS